MSLITVSKIQKESTATNIDVPSTGQFIDLASAAQGDVLYYNGTSYVRLAPGTAGQVLQTAGAGANPVWAADAGGLTAASQWNLTDTFAGDANPINANLAEKTTVGQGVLGSSMTESSGVFTFPSNGFWYVTATFTFNRFSGDAGAKGIIKYTADDGGAWSNAAQIYYYLDTAAQNYGTTSGSILFDITDRDNQKVSFEVSQSNNSNTTAGSTSGVNYTWFTFIKLADT